MLKATCLTGISERDDRTEMRQASPEGMTGQGRGRHFRKEYRDSDGNLVTKAKCGDLLTV